MSRCWGQHPWLYWKRYLRPRTVGTVATVTVSPSSLSSKTATQTDTLTATLLSAGAVVLPNSDHAITWASSDTAVAVVEGANGTCVVTYVAVGTCTITATSEGQSGTCSVSVTVANTPPRPEANGPYTGIAGLPLQFSRAGTYDVESGWTFEWDAGDGNGFRGPYSAVPDPFVTYTTAGTYTATLRVTDTGGLTATDTATVTIAAPGPAAVASVTVAPATASFIVGATQVLTATPKDASSTALTGREVTWSTSDVTIATVAVNPANSNQATVTAIGAGSATITATCETITGTATMTISAAPVAALPNLPPGYTFMTERTWASEASLLTDAWIHETPMGSVPTRYALAAQDQVGPGTYVRALIYAGDTGGPNNATPFRFQRQSFANLTTTPLLAARCLYVSYWIRFSSAFQGHPTGTNKIGFCWIRDTNAFFWSAEGVGSGNLVLYPRTQQPVSVDSREYFAPNQGRTGILTRNVWHQVETELIANTASNADGVLRCWLNGQLIHETLNMRYALTGQSHIWSRFDDTPLWGGGGGTVTANMEMHYGLQKYYYKL